MPDGTAERAAALAGRWSELALRHVSMGAACGCGIGGVTLRLQDFERDIAGYLHAEAERAGEAAALALLRRHAPDTHGDGQIDALLAALAANDADADPAASAWLLALLERTVASFARLHGGARFFSSPGRPKMKNAPSEGSDGP